jgi:CDP-diacylglycerol---glycerol-3-phosphate 3-phosphatidyltransferase
VINAKLRKGWDKTMQPVGRWLARTPLSADAVTLFGVALQGWIAYLIVDGHLLWAGLMGIPAGFADALDGALAKAKGKASKWGAFFDSTTDRLSDALVLAPIAWLYGVSPDSAEHASQTTALLALVALVASFLVSYSKARAESLGFKCDVGIAERAERLIIIYAALILDFVPLGVGILAALGTITFLQRVIYVYGQREARGS